MINWKLFLTVIIIITISVVIIKVIPNFISGGDKEVTYQVLDENQIPEKINKIIPRYKMLERALAAKVEDEVYVIVTRGEKLTGGYHVDIEKIQFLKGDSEARVVVHVLFKDPNPDDLVPQVVTYPYVVVKTNLTELPPRIDLEVKQKE